MITQQQSLEDIEQKEQSVAMMVEAEHELLGDDQREQEMQRIAQMRLEMMDSIGAQMLSQLAEAVAFRQPFERDWAEDIKQYEYGDPRGSGDLPSTKERPSEEQWKGAIDNVTRYSTVTYAARLSDMLFPTNDRNWDIDHTPKPDLPPDVEMNLRDTLAQLMQQGMVTPENEYETIEQLRLAAARKRTARMRQNIDDQLQESNYADHGREAIFSACRIGHGVIKGPFAVAKRRRRYVSGAGFKASIEEILNEPKVESVDPWLVFPRPCRRMKDCPGVFELHEYSPKRVSELRMQPGFSGQQIDRLLKQAPSWSSVATTVHTMRGMHDAVISARNENYAVFEYNGEMPKEAAMIFIEQLLSENRVTSEARNAIIAQIEERNSLHLNCTVWFSQGVVLKVAVSPVDYEGCLYKFFVFEEHESAPFGKGVPRILRDTQSSIRQLWAAILLNTLMSSAPQIGVMKGQLEPQNGQADLRFTQPRVWSFVGEMTDVRQIMQVFTIPNTCAATLPVYQQAKQNVLEQIMLPQIGQGDPTQAVQTSSGLAMLMNASNIVQRRMAARFDTDITSPLMRAMYEWNMEHGEEDAKGDYKVIPRASSHLLVKDIQSQHFFMALQMYASNAKLEPRMRWEAWGEEGMKILDLDASRFLLTEEEYQRNMAKAAQSQPKDAQTIRAEAAAVEAQTSARKVEGELALGQQRIDAMREDRALDFEDRIADRESLEMRAAMAMRTAMAGLTAEQQSTAMRLYNESQRDAERNATQTRIAGMKVAARAQEVAAQQRADQVEIQAEANRTEGPILS